MGGRDPIDPPVDIDQGLWERGFQLGRQKRTLNGSVSRGNRNFGLVEQRADRAFLVGWGSLWGMVVARAMAGVFWAFLVLVKSP